MYNVPGSTRIILLEWILVVLPCQEDHIVETLRWIVVVMMVLNGSVLLLDNRVPSILLLLY